MTTFDSTKALLNDLLREIQAGKIQNSGSNPGRPDDRSTRECLDLGGRPVSPKDFSGVSTSFR